MDCSFDHSKDEVDVTVEPLKKNFLLLPWQEDLYIVR